MQQLNRVPLGISTWSLPINVATNSVPHKAWPPPLQHLPYGNTPVALNPATPRDYCMHPMREGERRAVKERNRWRD
jgi:hypothetical protein